jgi:hypothetical protein
VRQTARRMSYPVNGPRHLAEAQRRQTLGLRFVPLQVTAEIIKRRQCVMSNEQREKFTALVDRVLDYDIARLNS